MERFIPPKKGKTHILRIIREILQFQPVGEGTSIDTGLVYLSKVIKKKAILFLLSDFIDTGFTQSLKIASRKHDLIAIKVSDMREKTLPESGVFVLRDHETGREFFVDFSSRQIKQRFLENSRENEDKLLDIFKKYNIDHIGIDHEEEYEKPLFDFFMERRRRFAR